MNLTLLDTFRTVVREGGALRAAQKLGCTQSNVTARIRQLEEDLGVALFERNGKRLVLNPAGQRLLPFCDELSELVSRARHAVATHREPITLRVGSMESTAASRLPAIVASLKRLAPEVAVTLTIDAEPQLLSLLSQRQIDVALTARATARKGFVYVPVFDEELVVVSACDKSASDLTNARELALLAFAEGCPYRTLAENWLRRRHIRIAQQLRCTSYDAIISCAAAGMGVAVVPRRLVAEGIERGELRGHAFADLRPATTYSVTIAGHTPPHAMEAWTTSLAELADARYHRQLQTG